jgi:hypothetical protein
MALEIVRTVLWLTGLLLLFCTVLKVAAATMSVLWLIRHGREHVANVRKQIEEAESRALLPVDYFKSFAAAKGSHWPFGVKDYILRLRLIELFKTRPILAMVLNYVRGALFTYPILILVVPLYVIVATISSSHYGLNASALFGLKLSAFLYIVALAGLIVNIPIIAEQTIGFSISGSYAEFFQVWNAEKSGHSGIDEGIKLVGCLIIGIVGTGVSAVFSTLLFFKGLTLPADINWQTLSADSICELLIYCLYFTLTTLSTTGYGDIHAVNTAGRVVCILLQTLSFFVVTFVLALFWSSRTPSSTSQARHRASPRAGL